MKNSSLLKLTLLTVLATALTACASTNHLEEKTIAEQLKEISISEKAAELLATETDEALIREELVCSEEPTLGTRFTTKVCRTQTELDDMRKTAKRDAEVAYRLIGNRGL